MTAPSPIEREADLCLDAYEAVRALERVCSAIDWFAEVGHTAHHLAGIVGLIDRLLAGEDVDHEDAFDIAAAARRAALA